MSRAFPILFGEPGRDTRAGTLTVAADLRVAGPLVSCLMVTRGRRFPAALAIDCYRRQSYAARELVIVSAAERCEVRGLVEQLGDPTIRYVAAAPAALGELRNISVAHAAGELLCQWDDDDLADPDRIALTMATFIDTDVKACFLYEVMLWWPERRRAAISSRRTWENTMLVHRGVLPIYPALAMAEDNAVVRMILANHRVAALSAPEAYVYVAHGGNVCPTEHFAMLFDRAAELEATAYDAWLTEAGARLPLRAYAERRDPG